MESRGALPFLSEIHSNKRWIDDGSRTSNYKEKSKAEIQKSIDSCAPSIFSSHNDMPKIVMKI